MKNNSGHIVILIPGFAADENDESCLPGLQSYPLSLKKIAPDKLITIIMFENYQSPIEKCDVVLIGSGIMSATLGVFLKELQPDLNIKIFEPVIFALQLTVYKVDHRWHMKQ